MILERVRALRSDERGVSPVLGVALLIAITVTLVAVIGFVVLGIGPTNTGAPQATLVFDTQANNTSDVIMTHQGGDKLVNSTLEIKIDNNNDTGVTTKKGTLKKEMSAGVSATVATNADPGDVVKIVWQAPSSDESQVIASFEVG